MKTRLAVILLAALAAPAFGQTVPTVGRWARFERSVANTRSYADPYSGVALNVQVTRPDGSTFSIRGFHDGGSTWRLRIMPDRTGRWSYTATFSDGAPGASGAFDCVSSTLRGMIAKDETNPKWFGYKGGNHVLLRGLHVGDRFFASNWDPAQRTRFLDWAVGQKYNLLSVASHYLNRNVSGRGAGWNTPDLWPLNAAEFREMEAILDDLAARGIHVYPFAGFFGKASDFPRDAAGQSRYIDYVHARLGSYWNVLLNVAGPEPLLDNYLTSADINRLGTEIRSKDPYGHLLSVHNRTGDDPFKDQAWHGYGTLQGPKTTSVATLSAGLLRNHHASKPLLAQETLWSGNKNHPNYSDTQLRKNAFVIQMSAAALVFGDMDSNLSDGAQGDSSAGFSGSMDLAQRLQGRHDIVKRVWDVVESFPFYRMSPRQDLVSSGYCLAEPGQRYLVYLPARGTVSVTVSGGPYAVEWINAQDAADRRSGGTTSDGQNLTTPAAGDDWLLSLVLSSGSNAAPSVSAGPDRTVTLPGSASLDGTVSDDGKPGGALTTTWSKASGPGTVTFANASAVDTTAAFSVAGTYVLRLTASDGALSSSDTMTAVVQSGTASQAVTRLMLVNADSDADLGAMVDGQTLNLATLPTRRLSIRADTSPSVVGSVRFAYDGNTNYRTENSTPYAIAGDDPRGNYNPWTPAVGSHTLTATPYSGSNASGAAGAALTVRFTVVDDASNAPPAVSITSPSNNATFSAGSTIAIAATASDPDGTVSFVDFYRGTTHLGMDSTTPYGVTWANVPAGTYTLTAKATDNGAATTTSSAVTITVVSSTGPSVASFTLVNADTDSDIGPLAGGQTINLATARRLNVRANTSPSTVGSVRFGYDGNANYRIENGAPYALAGNSGTDYAAWTPTVGSHSITATPYTQSNAGGTAGASKTVTFTVVDQAALVASSDPGPAETQAVDDDGGGRCGALGLEVLLLALLRRRRWAVVLPALVLLAAAAPAALFYETGGVIAMEAENATSRSGWVSVAGSSGTAMRDEGTRGVGHLTFEMELTQGGTYYVWLLCRHTSATGENADDAFVEVDGQKLYGSDGTTRPDGMQAASGSFSWSSRPKGPGSHTPTNIAAGPVHAKIAGPGRRVFKIISRSAGFEVDKIVLRKDDATKPTGMGPAETLAAGTAPPPTSAPPSTSSPDPVALPGGDGGSPSPNGDASLNDSMCGGAVAGLPSLWPAVLGAACLLPSLVRGPKVFVEKDGIVSMEAENATVARQWKEVPGTSGRAMLDEGGGHLSFEILFRKAGRYQVWMLCRDQGNTETNDCFVTLGNQRLYAVDGKTRPDGVRSAGSTFKWVCQPKGPGGKTPAEIGGKPVYAHVPGPGRHVLKVAHRSKGFEVDKIVLRLEGEGAPEGAGPAETGM